MSTSLTLLVPTLLVMACASANATTATTPRPERPTARAFFERGMQSAERGDGLRAEQYLLLAVEAGYPREQAILPLVRVCIASSRLRAALNHAQAFLRSHPNAWSLRYLSAAIALALGSPSTALVELQRVIAYRPEMAQAHYLAAIIARDAFHDQAAAASAFQAYLARQPRGIYAAEALAWLRTYAPPHEVQP